MSSSLRPYGIYCLEEADWWWRTNEVSTVAYLLEFLRQPPANVPFLRMDASTKQELGYYLGRWKLRKYDRFRILYLAFHGAPGVIYCGDQRRGKVALEEIGELLEGGCRGRIVHLGGCGTLRVAKHRIEDFLWRTGALAVCGYSRMADWLVSAAFELVLFSTLQEVPMTERGVERARDRVWGRAQGLAEQLRFNMYVRSDFA